MTGVREMSKQKIFRILGIVFACMALALLAVSAVLYSFRRSAVAAATETADGVVVDMASHGKKGRGRRPVIEIRTAEGTPVRFQTTYSSSPPKYAVGDHVPVRYDPSSPEDAFVDSFWERWFFPLLFLMIGAPYVLVAAAMTFVAARLRARDEELRTRGDRVPGTVAAVERTRDRKRKTYHLMVEVRESTQRYKSNPVYVQDGEPEKLVGRGVMVLVDRGDPSRYLVELGD